MTYQFGGTNWTTGPVSNKEGMLSATVTRGDGAPCQRALTVANNVAVDTQLCSPNPDSAVTVARQIADKVEK
jgi:serine/threonine kinase PknH